MDTSGSTPASLILQGSRVSFLHQASVESFQQEINLSAVDGHNMQGGLLGYKGGNNILMLIQESIFLTVDTTFWCHHNRASAYNRLTLNVI